MFTALLPLPSFPHRTGVLRRLAWKCIALTWGLAAGAGACAGESGHVVAGPYAEVASPPAGILDRGDDPAVVAIDAGGQLLCTGALIAPDVVLTSRACVAITVARVECPPPTSQILAAREPRSLRVLVGEDAGSARERARGRSVVVPAEDALCGADIALVLLDATIDDVRPLSVRSTGAAQGDHVRTVAYGRQASSASSARRAKVVRDHVHVLESRRDDLVLEESACERAVGGPALDESTGEVVGVSARADDASCTGSGATALYTRTDAFLPLIGEALAQSSGPAPRAAILRTKKGPIDMGSTCAEAVDCAAGVCVTLSERQYCSRACGPYDRCPARFRCRRSQLPLWVCTLP